MSVITTYFANLVLQKIFKGGPTSRTAYLGVHTGDPGDNDANEYPVSARDTLINDRDWEPAANKAIRTNKAFTTGASGFAGSGLPMGTTITHLGFWTQRAANGGKVWFAFELVNPVTISAPGGLINFPAGAIEVQFKECDSSGQTQVSEYCANKVLDWFFRGANRGGFWDAHPVSLSLHDGDPGTDGANEISGRSYGRQIIPPEMWGAPSEREILLAKAIEWPDIPTATITHAGIWDKAGQFLFSALLPTPVVWLRKYTARLSAGQLKVSLGCDIAPPVVSARLKLFHNDTLILDFTHTEEGQVLPAGKSALVCRDEAPFADVDDRSLWNDLAITGSGGFSFADSFNRANADTIGGAYDVLGPPVSCLHIRSNQYVGIDVTNGVDPGKVGVAIPDSCPDMASSQSQIKLGTNATTAASGQVCLASRITAAAFPFQAYIAQFSLIGDSMNATLFLAQANGQDSPDFNLGLLAFSDTVTVEPGDIVRFETSDS